MPWKEVTTMDARVSFILEWNSQKYGVTELCARYGVSRKTAYKWINRYLEHGPDGLWERSHAPHQAATQGPRLGNSRGGLPDQVQHPWRGRR